MVHPGRRDRWGIRLLAWLVAAGCGASIAVAQTPSPSEPARTEPARTEPARPVAVRPKPEETRPGSSTTPKPEETRPRSVASPRPTIVRPEPRPEPRPIPLGRRLLLRRRNRDEFFTMSLAPKLTYFGSKRLLLGSLAAVEASRFPFLFGRIAAGGGYFTKQPDALDSQKAYQKTFFLMELGILVNFFGFPCIRSKLPKVRTFELLAGPVVSVFANRPETTVAVEGEVGFSAFLADHWKLGLSFRVGWSKILTHAYITEPKNKYSLSPQLFAGYRF